ncbi:MAG: hypothetical protein Q9200_001131 [Gallowayella weberi]
MRAVIPVDKVSIPLEGYELTKDVFMEAKNIGAQSVPRNLVVRRLRYPTSRAKKYSQRELKSHVEVRHGTLSVDDRKTYLCPEPGCDRAFTKKGNLNVHIESTHKSKKYVCGAVSLESLNNVEGWDGLNACGRALTTKGSLQTHIRTVHMGIERRRRRKPKTAEDDPLDDYDGHASNLMKLTGAGYDDDIRRHLHCLMPDCNFRFSRGYDLRNHLINRHGLEDNEADTLLTEGTEGNRGSAITGEQKQHWTLDVGHQF